MEVDLPPGTKEIGTVIEVGPKGSGEFRTVRTPVSGSITWSQLRSNVAKVMYAWAQKYMHDPERRQSRVIQFVFYTIDEA